MLSNETLAFAHCKLPWHAPIACFMHHLTWQICWLLRLPLAAGSLYSTGLLLLTTGQCSPTAVLDAQFDLAELLAGMKSIERLWLSSSAGCCFTGLNACGRTLQRLDLEIAGVPPAALDLSGLEQLRRCARACRWPSCMQT